LEKGGVQAVSGTPGRLKDVLEKGALRARSVRCLVIDEADEMLSEGFKEQVYHVYRFLPAEAQVVLVSATLPGEVLRMTEQFMTDPVKVLVRRDELTLEVRSDRQTDTVADGQDNTHADTDAAHTRARAPFLTKRTEPPPNKKYKNKNKKTSINRALSSSSSPSRRRSGSSTRCATCTTRSPSRRPSSLSTLGKRWSGYPPK